MTWFTKEDGYELFFNRDERLSRRRALLPTVQRGDAVDYISPTDSDAGGTWIAANQYGVTVCLLNHYQFEQIETYKKWISRGEMVRSFSNTTDMVSAERNFNTLDLGDYRAFRMFMVDRHGDSRLFVWDGHSARIERNVSTPKSSSSVDSKNVKAKRKKLFADLNLIDSKQAADYINYHASHLPSRSKDSVCMHREDAKTVSLSHVNVTSSGVYFSYADGSPCEVPLGEPLFIELLEPVIDSCVTNIASVR